MQRAKIPKAEVEKIVNCMKNYKATDPGEIAVEQRNGLEEFGN